MVPDLRGEPRGVVVRAVEEPLHARRRRRRIACERPPEEGERRHPRERQGAPGPAAPPRADEDRERREEGREHALRSHERGEEPERRELREGLRAPSPIVEQLRRDAGCAHQDPGERQRLHAAPREPGERAEGEAHGPCRDRARAAREPLREAASLHGDAGVRERAEGPGDPHEREAPRAGLPEGGEQQRPHEARRAARHGVPRVPERRALRDAPRELEVDEDVVQRDCRPPRLVEDGLDRESPEDRAHEERGCIHRERALPESRKARAHWAGSHSRDAPSPCLESRPHGGAFWVGSLACRPPLDQPSLLRFENAHSRVRSPSRSPPPSPLSAPLARARTPPARPRAAAGGAARRPPRTRRRPAQEARPRRPRAAARAAQAVIPAA